MTISEKYFLIWITSLIDLLLFKGIGCLRITEFHVPEKSYAGESIKFMCLYDLEDDKLYSLKWYKNETEFYRYEPNGVYKIQIFPIPEINLDLRKSDNGTQLVVRDINQETSGNYKCEISADGTFLTVQKEQMMTVIAGASSLIESNKLIVMVTWLSVGVMIVTQSNRSIL